MSRLGKVGRMMAAVVLCWCSSAAAAGGGEPQMTTGRTITAADMRQRAPGAALTSLTYAEVNSAWLREYYPVFRQALHREGILRWGQQFDCSSFALSYVARAQERWFRASFHVHQAPAAIAIGFAWVQRPDGVMHALAVAITERGPLYIDPQTGGEVALSGETPPIITLMVM
jgi:hypothetical protein